MTTLKAKLDHNDILDIQVGNIEKDDAIRLLLDDLETERAHSEETDSHNEGLEQMLKETIEHIQLEAKEANCELKKLERLVLSLSNGNSDADMTRDDIEIMFKNLSRTINRLEETEQLAGR